MKSILEKRWPISDVHLVVRVFFPLLVTGVNIYKNKSVSDMHGIQ
jgi:hypothetical protein